jgi:hypothetical protein
MSDDSKAPAWEVTQKKTFTKWCNTHLSKAGKPVLENIVTDWDTGLNLINLAVALYSQNEKEPEKAISMPKLKDNELNAKNRIQRVQVCSKGINLLKTAGVDLRTVSAEICAIMTKLPFWVWFGSSFSTTPHAGLAVPLPRSRGPFLNG